MLPFASSAARSDPMRLGAKLVGISLVLLCIPASGLANNDNSPYRAHPSLQAKKSSIKSVAILLPRIEHFEVSAGGVVEKMPDWTIEGNRNLLEGLSKALTTQGALVVSSLAEDSLSSELEANLEETYALYETVSSCILLHAYWSYGPQAFPTKVQEFDYSLGPEVHALAPDADAFLLVRGVDQRSSGGRQALQVGAMILGASVGVIPIMQGGGNEVSVALVEGNSGTILWYYRVQASYDFRSPSDVEWFVRKLMRSFPFP
jgi:hypothetical protein